VLPEAVSSAWAPVSSRRRMAEGLAMFLQFQGQINDIVANSPTQISSGVRAVDYFSMLPPCGLIPAAGFDPSKSLNVGTFFDTLTTRNPVFIEGVRVETLIQHSYIYAPINVTNFQQMIWTYVIRENMQSATGTTPTSPTRALIFTTGFMHYQGEPQFNLSHWNYANFAIAAI